MRYLILGGARSGKSEFAENLALELHAERAKNSGGAELFYLATCASPSEFGGDTDMEARIILHQQRRDDMWINIEEPLNITPFLEDLDHNSTILVDCLTLWISNLMYGNLDIEQEFDDLCDLIDDADINIVFVSNELGMGLVPDTKIGRDFRDFQGKLNQLMAQRVDKVALIVAGLPIWVK